jgi:hypothetical protein
MAVIIARKLHLQSSVRQQLCLLAWCQGWLVRLHLMMLCLHTHTHLKGRLAALTDIDGPQHVEL